MNNRVHIALNAHKNSIVPAYALPDGSPPQGAGRWGGSNLSAERGLLRLVKKLGVSKKLKVSDISSVSFLSFPFSTSLNYIHGVSTLFRTIVGKDHPI